MTIVATIYEYYMNPILLMIYARHIIYNYINTIIIDNYKLYKILIFSNGITIQTTGKMVYLV